LFAWQKIKCNSILFFDECTVNLNKHYKKIFATCTGGLKWEGTAVLFAFFAQAWMRRNGQDYFDIGKEITKT
jgi:hypothetical protein